MSEESGRKQYSAQYGHICAQEIHFMIDFQLLLFGVALVLNVDARIILVTLRVGRNFFVHKEGQINLTFLSALALFVVVGHQRCVVKDVFLWVDACFHFLGGPLVVGVLARTEIVVIGVVGYDARRVYLAHVAAPTADVAVDMSVFVQFNVLLDAHWRTVLDVSQR